MAVTVNDLLAVEVHRVEDPADGGDRDLEGVLVDVVAGALHDVDGDTRGVGSGGCPGPATAVVTAST